MNSINRPRRASIASKVRPITTRPSVSKIRRITCFCIIQMIAKMAEQVFKINSRRFFVTRSIQQTNLIKIYLRPISKVARSIMIVKEIRHNFYNFSSRCYSINNFISFNKSNYCNYRIK